LNRERTRRDVLPAFTRRPITRYWRNVLAMTTPNTLSMKSTLLGSKLFFINVLISPTFPIQFSKRDPKNVSHPWCLPSLHSIYIRENSIEYNQPTLQPAKAENPMATVLCCGNSPTTLIVRDHVSTIYFDDILMDSVRNDTRPCNPLHTFCCGGRGEEVRLESRFCWDFCYRGRGIGTEECGLLSFIFQCCMPCVPVVCPDCLCPCAARVSPRMSDVSIVLLLSCPLSA
jgi:hypothetical protein